jgi:hypothetical protein
MNELIRVAFGLEELGIGQEGVQLGFARPIPGWAWALVIAGAVTIAWWSYWRMDAARTGRVVLATLRAVLLIALVAVITGPRLVRPNIVVEPDWVIVLVDRSASMSIRDVGDSTRMTREQELRDMLASSWPMWQSLTDERRLVWLGFDSGAYDLEQDENGLELSEPAGTRTSVGSALDQALRRAAARPVSAVVVISDGRSVDRASRQAMRRLEAERIPVFTIPMGRPDPLADLAVERVQSPRMAFVDDTIPISVYVRRLGGSAWPPARVELIDRPTGLVLDEAALEPEEGETDSATVLLRVKPDDAGKQSWQVRVVTAQPDLVESNNSLGVGIELVDRPLRVLYLDGYPRWEQRFVEQLLLREKSIMSSSLMVASNRRYTQESDRLIDGVPRSPEEWAEFDVVVIGDVNANLFGLEQLAQLREHVAVRGAGLLWMAGPGATPATWRSTPLGDLIPFRLGGGRASAVEVYNQAVTMSRTDAATRLGLLGLSDDGAEWPEMLSDPQTGWSRLWYAQRIEDEALKPAAQVLARVSTSYGSRDDASTPAVISMRYGAGRVIYVATDEIWRWRWGRGETVTERFWLPLIRLQGRESLARGGAAALLEAMPDRAVVGEPIRLSIRVLDERLLETRPRGLDVRITLVGDETVPTRQLRLAPDDSAGDGIGQVYSATWLAPAAGTYEIEAIDAALAGMDLKAEVEVSLSDDELRRPETDHLLLASLSQSTGGRTLDIANVHELPELLPRRRMEVAGEPDIETLWDRPIVLATLVLLLAAEWIGRRFVRLS